MAATARVIWLAVRMREVLVRPWVGLCAPLALSFLFARNTPCTLHLSRSHGDRWGATDLQTISLHLTLFSDSLVGCRKISTLFTQRCYSPDVSFVGLFFFLLTLFPTKLSRHTLLILIHGQTTLKICVSLPWLRNHPRALWLAA